MLIDQRAKERTQQQLVICEARLREALERLRTAFAEMTPITEHGDFIGNFWEGDVERNIENAISGVVQYRINLSKL